jgi:hypothetical protein
MVRAIATAHSSLRSAQTDKAGKKVPSNIKGLDYTSVTLPRLPPWIPRDSTAPIVASDEQLATFLESSPLAHFECTDCKGGFNGSRIFSHFGQSYGCHSALVHGQQPQLDAWARIDAPPPGKNTMKCDRDVLLVALKLNQLVDDTPLDYHEEEIEEVAATLSKEWQAPGKKYSVMLKCDCSEHVPYYSTAYATRSAQEMVRRSSLPPFPFFPH